MTGWHELLIAETYITVREQEIKRDLERKRQMEIAGRRRERNAARFVRGMREWLGRHRPGPHRHN